MRFHVIGLPHTITHKLFLGCAFTGHIMRICKGFKERGHHVIHYGNYGSELECSENIEITDKKFVDKNIGKWKYPEFHETMYADRHLPEKENIDFHINLVYHISKNVEKDDIVILSYGTFIEYAIKFLEHLQNLPVFLCESTIGYLDSWRAPYKVFESESVRSWNRSQWNQNWRHFAHNGGDFNNVPDYAVHECTPQFTDDTIHTFADPDLFEYKENKQDYFLYLGRLIPSKGINLAVDVCEKIGQKLVVAGHGNLEESIGREIPSCVEFVGYADAEVRKELMSNAKGGFVCTYYSEHGGNVIHELGLSGTPVIATNWGSFTHSVLHKKTGYLIQDGAEAQWAAKNIDKIEPWRCRKWQMNYTIERTIPKFERYFERIKHIHYNDGDAFETYPVYDLDHRELIHPDDPNYDINLAPVGQESVSVKHSRKPTESV